MKYPKTYKILSIWLCEFHLRTKLLDNYKTGVWCNTSRTSTIFYIC